jgi:tetratricopeptide (TPR) repeat protein
MRMAEPMRALMRTGLAGEDHEMALLEAYFHDPDPWAAAVARAFHGHAVMNLGGDRPTAEEDFAVALAGFRAVGDRWGLVLVLDALATMDNQSGDHARAAERWREAIRLAEELNIREDVVQQRMNLTWALWLNGEHEEAIRMLEDAARASRDVGLPQTGLIVEFGRANLLRMTGRLPEAAEMLRKTLDGINLVVAAPQFRAMIGSTLGLVLAELGDLDAAAVEQDKALDEAISSGDAPIASMVLVGYADVAMRRGAMEKAAALLGATEGVAGAVDHSSVDRPRIESVVRAALGPAGFDRAYARGTAYTLKNLRELD